MNICKDKFEIGKVHIFEALNQFLHHAHHQAVKEFTESLTEKLGTQVCCLVNAQSLNFSEIGACFLVDFSENQIIETHLRRFELSVILGG